ncbi:hypothetical protein AMJ85_06850 [candidate division BRC1 bacterium SM23_51]|nr:MAG: hypothetical protein AMJ85_06850 [candidate division BRC1 bacterium SM23_51]
MRVNLQRVGIIGSGVMGGGIAAQLANAGVSSLVLDIAPTELLPKEEAKGLSLGDRQVRKRIASANIQAQLKLKPPPFFEAECAELIEPGNVEDDFERLKEVDWIIEAVPEKVQIKQDLYARLEDVVQPGQIVSSNTSGISIKDMMAGRSEALRRQFVVTHFFNPPRYMRLLELIASTETDPEILERAAAIGSQILGKGVVYAKDTPNFIANRIGIAEIGRILNAVVERGFNIDEVDALTGKAVGRPKSGTFRLIDIVGLDTLVNNSKYLAGALGDDPAVKSLELPDFVHRMMEGNLLGEKTGAGFYKRVKTEKGKEILALNLETLEYGPRSKPRLACLAEAKKPRKVGDRIKAVAWSDDRGGKFVWDIISRTLVYAALKVPEISDDILNIDRAMRWGFNWELGPFEIWDAFGVQEVAERLESEGREVPPLVRELLASGANSFYRIVGVMPTYFDAKTKTMEPIPPRDGVLELAHLKLDSSKVVLGNEAASLVDLGDGVACIEFHSKMNTISGATLDLIHDGLDRVEKEFDAVILGNQGDNFCAGADLLALLSHAQAKDWDAIDSMITRFQNCSMRLKYLSKPTVGCPHGMTLGGGCEVNLHCHRIRAAAETYMGLVELGVGLIPAGAGTKEMAIRFQEHIPSDVEVNRLPFLDRVFRMIGTAKVSGSALEAQSMGLLRVCDSWSMNKDCQIQDAKTVALSLVAEGFRAPRQRPVRVTGSEGLAMLQVVLRNMLVAGYISEYDHHLGENLAHVLCGGDVPDGTLVSEQYLLDLEREVFLHLCGQEKTQERIAHTLKTGKPLRN